eukprot:3284994-Pleurochrysis_carterae.AAC.1
MSDCLRKGGIPIYLCLLHRRCNSSAIPCADAGTTIRPDIAFAFRGGLDLSALCLKGPLLERSMDMRLFSVEE